MKKVTKAIIPAAGFGTRFLPATKALPKEMLPIVDTPTIQYIVEEAIESGIKDILIVTSTYKNAIIDHFDKSYELEDVLYKKAKNDLLEQVQEISNMANVHFIRQKEALGLGHAVLQAKSFVGDEAFAVMLGDDVVYSEGDLKPALQQLIEVYDQTGASVVGVQTVPKEDVSKYGIVEPIEKSTTRNHKLKGIVEKPAVEKAPSQMAVLGRYVLTPEIFELLETQNKGAGDEIQLTDAIERLLKTQAVYAYDFEGVRYDVGDKFGFIKATIDYALRDEKISNQVEEYIQKIAKK